ncbi:phage major tail tube protein, partial [Burkholderia pseudomallei]|uniref:phage major tail tube protein n=1 Tax=Burkholderia pseudomallei TaxID=28450 RepID=UPI0021F6DC2B
HAAIPRVCRRITDKTKTRSPIMRVSLSAPARASCKPGGPSESKYNAALSYYEAAIDGAVIHEIDAFNMIRVIDGVDQLAEVRKALGM